MELTEPSPLDQPVGKSSDIAEYVELPALRALLRISEAVGQANFFDEALEVIAEQALVALNAAAVSVSRWERHHDALRTLINVGLLGPGEQRWPENETHPQADNPHLRELLLHGQPYVTAVEDTHLHPSRLAWLREIGKESELGVPVIFGNITWGELWVAGVDGRRFGRDDVQLLQAIAAHAALAIGRSELFSTVWRYAFQDPLTGLANRRALDEYFNEIDWGTVRPIALMCDLDGFKEVNDQDGHAAGDALLREVATILTDTVPPSEASIVVRLGGDEFCIVLGSATLADAEQFVRIINDTVAKTIDADVTLSWGAAAFELAHRSGAELIAAADAALLKAKRHGRGLFRTAGTDPATRPSRHRGQRPATARRALDRLLPQVVELLDESRPADTAAALEILAIQVHTAVNAAGWSISVMTDDGSGVRGVRRVDDTLDQASSGRSVVNQVDTDTVRLLSDHPAIAGAIQTGAVFVAAADREASEPTQTAHLGYRGVLGVGVADADRRYLLEIYSASGHVELDAVAPQVRVLAHYCSLIAGPRGV